MFNNRPGTIQTVSNKKMSLKEADYLMERNDTANKSNKKS